jgi:hypothetical protein
LKPAHANCSERPYLGKTKQNKTKQNKTPKGAGEVTQDVGPEFKPQYRKKEKTESVVA